MKSTPLGCPRKPDKHKRALCNSAIVRQNVQSGSGVPEVTYLKAIKLEFPEKRVYQRLGCHPSKVQMAGLQKEKLQEFFSYARERISLVGALRRVEIAIKNEEVSLATGQVFRTRALSNFLGQATAIFLLAASAGEEIMKAIADDSKQGFISRGVVLDAVASEMVDAALTWILHYGNKFIQPYGEYAPMKRFSCGYGDFPIEYQRDIFSLLHLERIGMVINEACYLIPEKSVTAIAGIYRSY